VEIEIEKERLDDEGERMNEEQVEMRTVQQL